MTKIPNYPVHGHPAMIEIPLATYREMQSELESLRDSVDKLSWHDYPKEKPTKSDRYIVEYLNPREGDAYVLSECDYLIGEDWTGWCTEYKIVRWRRY